MAAVELILLQRVEKLGQMGEVVKVKPGYARNYLLPQPKAVRATKANRERFERERAQLEAQNLKRRDEAERVAERVHGLSVTLIRQAAEFGSAVRLGLEPRHRGRQHRGGPRPSSARRSCSSTRSRRWASPRCASRCTRKSSSTCR